MATAEFTPDNNTIQPSGADADGPVESALLPMIRINGIVYVVDNCLHFFVPNIHSPRGT